MCMVIRNILTKFEDPRSLCLGVIVFLIENDLLTSSDLCVTFDILCLVTWVVVHQRILLTKFGQNWTFGYGARGRMPEERRTREQLSSEMTNLSRKTFDLWYVLTKWPQMTFCWPLTRSLWLTFFFVSPMRTLCNKQEQNRTLFKIFAL